MTARIFTAEQYNALKMATRKLHKKSGGLESAASLTRVQHAQLGVYQNVNVTDQFAPIDVIADLEHETGTPFVTEALCAINNGYYTPFTKSTAAPIFAANLAISGKEFADVMSRAAISLEDGIITKGEAVAIINEVNEAIQALAQLKSGLEGQFA
ncbi:MAG: hypothetical protein JKY93_01010 [Gammaproteobacteria bacterium]|nr:hypothetical protein [Gammaproteobacteria bacterium]